MKNLTTLASISEHKNNRAITNDLRNRDELFSYNHVKSLFCWTATKLIVENIQINQNCMTDAYLSLAIIDEIM